ncbi:preprotein translocase subunit YajC [Companilactobacillus allii]|uniref:Preprotein translocase subunit YajC n=1 Tax=Companilactobacillus allii TaxID=1847728 RepID=A0A1P8PZK6_9LACO|nr:preprotein translocase subunit YajC [Companilactobacillus allii]
MNYLTLGAAAGGSNMIFIVFIVIMFVGMYFISIRPQKKQQQKRQEMLKQMDKGDKVVTLGGVKGVIASIDRENKEVVVDCDGIYLTFDLNFIRRTTPAATGTVKSEDAPKEVTPKEETTEKVAPKEEAPKEAKSDDNTEDVKPEEKSADASDKDDVKEDSEEK